MSKEHKVILVPGLDERASWMKWATKNWQVRHDLDPVIKTVGWKDGADFRPMLEELCELVDESVAAGHKVSMIGGSGGGSAVLNAYVERKKSIHRVASLSGRLRAGKHKGFRSLESRSKASPKFFQSVRLFESKEELLTPEDRENIMTVTAMFGDEIVPHDTAFLYGAYNRRIPAIEHSLSIVAALTVYSEPLIAFLKEE